MTSINRKLIAMFAAATLMLGAAHGEQGTNTEYDWYCVIMPWLCS